MSLILDGKALAKETETLLKARVEAPGARTARTPSSRRFSSATIRRARPAVRMKGNACARVGMPRAPRRSSQADDDRRTSEQKSRNSTATDVHGILLQHPVPRHIDERAAFEAIEARKDVDGVTCPARLRRMAMGEKAYGCATRPGIATLLRHYKIQLEGNAVVVGGA